MSRGLPNGWAVVAAVVVVAGLLVVGPMFPNYTIGLAVRALVFVGVAAAWNILGGLGGALSLGHAAFFGVGAYAAGWLTSTTELPLVVILIIAAAAAGASASFLVPCFRARGFYFAILTLAMAEVVRELAEEFAPGGRSGLFFESFESGSLLPYHLALFGIVATVLATVIVSRSRLGAALMVTRLEPTAAADLGVDELSARVQALVVSAVFTGYFGAVSALNIGFLEPGTAFALTRSVDPVLATVLGGLGTVIGPLLGGGVWAAIGETLNRLSIGGAINYILTGGVLVLLTLAAPTGLHGMWSRLIGWVRRDHTEGDGITPDTASSTVAEH